MLQVVHLAAVGAVLVPALCLSASAQQMSIGFDQPCTAAFGPLGYPLNRFVPSEAAPVVRGKLRGVVARSLLWQPGETIKVCFRAGTQKGSEQGRKGMAQIVNANFGQAGQRPHGMPGTLQISYWAALSPTVSRVDAAPAREDIGISQ